MPCRQSSTTAKALSASILGRAANSLLLPCGMGFSEYRL